MQIFIQKHYIKSLPDGLNHRAYKQKEVGID